MIKHIYLLIFFSTILLNILSSQISSQITIVSISKPHDYRFNKNMELTYVSQYIPQNNIKLACEEVNFDKFSYKENFKTIEQYEKMAVGSPSLRHALFKIKRLCLDQITTKTHLTSILINIAIIVLEKDLNKNIFFLRFIFSSIPYLHDYTYFKLHNKNIFHTAAWLAIQLITTIVKHKIIH